MQPGSLVDAVAGVQPDPVPWDTVQRPVDGGDVPLGGLQLLIPRAGPVAELLGQEGVVDLKREARRDDRLVLHVQGVGDGVNAVNTALHDAIIAPVGMAGR